MSDLTNNLTKEFELKLKKSIEAFEKDLSTLRMGRASASLLNHIKVDSYGSFVPISQIATIMIPDSRTIVINVWDKGLVLPLEAAIRNSDLGLNPVVEGTKMRLPIPPLTEERRKEVSKKAAEFAEKGKIAIRHVRKLFLDALKDMEKNKEISEDEYKFEADHFEKVVKDIIKSVEEILKKKSQELMTI
ncbi:Ribosome-recycling factor [Candidatus Hepatincola sp. Av]